MTVTSVLRDKRGFGGILSRMAQLRKGLLAFAIVLGCSATKGEIDTLDGGGGLDVGGTVDTGGVGGDGIAPPPPGDTGACAAVSKKAEPGIAPVDLVWVVDSSGSMSNEAKRVQDNLNNFSTAMAKVGIDYHVVMITSSSFVKVPAPLGTSPSYMLVERDVASHDPLKAVLDEFPKYKSFLRPLAITHLIAVTDDESKPLTAEEFYKAWAGMLGHGFKAHAIASEQVPISLTNPLGACTSGGFPPEGAAAPGIQYYKLADATGGLKFSICTTDWTKLFGTLTAAVAVAEKIPCIFTIPAPPDGSTIDPTKVNVEYTSGSGKKETLVYLPTGKDGCAGAGGGWYYDDPVKPKIIYLCPSTCTTVSADKSGKVDIAFGCASRIK